MRNVLASSHSWDSLLHCTVAWATMSSDWQCEQTGVDLVATRLMVRAGLPGASTASNGLRSNASFIFPHAPANQQLPRGDDNVTIALASSPEFSGLWIVASVRHAQDCPTCNRDCRFYGLASRKLLFHNRRQLQIARAGHEDRRRPPYRLFDAADQSGLPNGALSLL